MLEQNLGMGRLQKVLADDTAKGLPESKSERGSQKGKMKAWREKEKSR